MRTIPLDAEHLGYFEERIDRLTPHSKRRWGKLSVEGMLAHLRTSIELSLKERPSLSASNALSRTRLFQWLVMEVMPWPKGIKAPDAMTPPPDGNLAAEAAALKAAMHRFVQAAQRDPERVTESAGFGPLSFRRWARLHGRHTRHHLEQFGIE